MKTRPDCSLCAAVFAALAIIGFSVHALVCSEKRRASDERTLKDAERDWEGEGGAVAPVRDEELAASLPR